MLNKILKFLTTRKEECNCHFCKKPFLSKSYKQRMQVLGLVSVAGLYCSKKCEKLMNQAIRKAFKKQKLSRLEKEAIKDLRYVDIHVPKARR